MDEKLYQTPLGAIHYWVRRHPDAPQLVFLPGLTADHRLFEKQVTFFEDRCSVFVWDAPVIVGQSMGGYVGQAYAELAPDGLRGFIPIAHSLGQPSIRRD